MKNPFRYGLRHAIYTLLCAILSSTILGYVLIFTSIDLFGKTEFLSWEMFVQIIMVATGGAFIENKRD